MKVDIYKRQEQYLNWKEQVLAEGIQGLTEANSSIIIQYVLDMEQGRNISKKSVKGGRGYPRLCNLTQRMTWIAKMLEERGVSDLRVCDEQTASSLFSDMDRGVILTRSNTRYKSHGDYARVFKSFWHWWMKVKRKEGQLITDITEDFRTASSKAPFVYISKERLDQLLPYFSEHEQALLYFLFDSLIRSPTEVLSLRAQDVYERDSEVYVTIPDEVSKTFGRTMNLLYSGQAMLDYIQRHKLAPSDPLFSFKPWLFSAKLKKVAVQLFGDIKSHAEGDYYRNITLYDLRHSGAVHLRLLAKENPGLISLDAVRHRGGWCDMKMLNYYTQFLGLDGIIKKQGVLLNRDKHQLEREVDTLKQELAAIKEMNLKILELTKQGGMNLFNQPSIIETS